MEVGTEAVQTVNGFSAGEWQRRHRKIRELMQLRDIDLLLITGNDSQNGAAACNLQYVSGAEDSGSYILLPLEGDIFALSNHKMPGEASVCSGGIPPFKKGKGEGKRIRDWAAGIAGKIKEWGMEKSTIGVVDLRVMPAGVYAEVLKELPGARFIPAGDILLQARRIKSAEELVYMRKAAECADAAAEAMMAAAVRPGARARDVQLAARMAMLERGANWTNFALVLVTSWQEIEAGIPPRGPEGEIKKGDIILNEIEPGYRGYYVQACYPIVIGTGLPGAFHDLFQLHKDIYAMANDALRPGTTVIDIERKVFQLAAGRGNFGRVWTLEAAEVEEALHKDTYAEIMPGMCFVNHPWTEAPARTPGFRGHLLGNTVVVTQSAQEITSKISVELKVV